MQIANGVSTVEDVVRQVRLIKHSINNDIDDFVDAVEEDAQIRAFINNHADGAQQIARLLFLAATHDKYSQIREACIDRSSRMELIQRLKDYVKKRT